jgi:hypothetical protein
MSCELLEFNFELKLTFLSRSNIPHPHERHLNSTIGSRPTGLEPKLRSASTQYLANGV